MRMMARLKKHTDKQDRKDLGMMRKAVADNDIYTAYEKADLYNSGQVGKTFAIVSY